MPYHIRWLVEKRVLLSTFSDTLTRTELIAYMGDVVSQLRNGTPIVYHMSDTLQLNRVEISLRAFQDLLKSFALFTDLGCQIDITKPNANGIFTSVASQFTRINVKHAASLEEAIAFLKQVAPDLRDLEWQCSTHLDP